MKKKKCLIPEEMYNKDFQPFTGFFEYHAKNRTVPVSLSEIQEFGVKLEVVNREVLNKLDTIPINTIKFSSSKKKRNVNNLMWYFRCLPCHPENINISNNQKCYQLQCCRNDNKTGEKVICMKGLVACDVWSSFIKDVTDKIVEYEKNI